MALNRKDAIVIPGTGGAFRPTISHLHFVLCDCDDSGKVLVAPVGTFKANSDKSCLLEVGDHAFIRHQSVILYSYFSLKKEGPLVADIKRGIVAKLEPATDALFQRILVGLRTSRFALPWARSKVGNPKL